MKTVLQEIIQWTIENAFNIEAQDGTTYIAIDHQEMRAKFDEWLDKEHDQISKAAKTSQRWIPVDEKEPESFKNDEDGIYYSKYLELKVNGYEYPLIGYYVNANDDQFFDLISEKDDDIKQEDITHYRECFL